MLYVTDTHPFLWYLSDDERLGTGAKEIFELAERGGAIVVVPVIVLAESLYIVAKKDFEIKFKDILEMVENSINFPPFATDIEVIKEAMDLEAISELHDKIIVATARLLNAALITKDKEIKKTGYVQTVW
jgi:predicted nucleic acid-binding protein